jgi:hypothetical protein
MAPLLPCLGEPVLGATGVRQPQIVRDRFRALVQGGDSRSGSAGRRSIGRIRMACKSWCPCGGRRAGVKIWVGFRCLVAGFAAALWPVPVPRFGRGARGVGGMIGVAARRRRFLSGT